MPKVTVSKRTGAKKKRCTRRTKEQILGLILEAAGEEFELNGYEGAKTAVIAEKARVAEALIFSNFGSKAKLFHDAIFEPLQQHLLRFQTQHRVEAGDRDGRRAGTQQYILELLGWPRKPVPAKMTREWRHQDGLMFPEKLNGANKGSQR